MHWDFWSGYCMTFYTLFFRTENTHLAKDVGMIPETLAKEHPDVRSFIVTYKNGEYPYVGKQITHAKMIFVKKRFGRIIDGISFIKKNADDIDVLNIYHLNLSSYFYCLAAKKYLKPKAKVYLKLDLGPAEITKLRRHDLRALIKKKTIKLADIVSGETSKLVSIVWKEVDPKVEFITNGNYSPVTKASDPSQKQSRMITVGMLGSEPKNTVFLIDAFVRSADRHDLQLRLIGPYTDEVSQKVSDTIKAHPELSARIVLTGKITDKNELANEYARAKIFILPSKWESFGFVLLEALGAGCFLLVSDNVPLAHDILYAEDSGRIIEGFDTDSWADAITKAANSDIEYSKKCADDFRFIEDNFDWKKVANRIYDLLKDGE